MDFLTSNYCAPSDKPYTRPINDITKVSEFLVNCPKLLNKAEL